MFEDDRAFEDEVRRIARLLWPSAEFGGAGIEDGRERDGIFETEDFVHLIECTVSRGQAKAQDDGKKLGALIRKFEAAKPTKHVTGWFITRQEPTADQRDAIRKQKSRINAVSFDQFRAKLVDGRTYITVRQNYPFGSLRDPQSGGAIGAFDYVPLQLLDSKGSVESVDGICTQLEDGAAVVVLGEYGAGKSATSREIYLKLAKRYWDGKSLRLPILLNLRDHHGQTDPIEALERHARKLGFSQPSGLVKAWRAGHAMLLLDGFDEIAAAGWAGRTRRLRDLRYRSMELLRHFMTETPKGTGTLLAGRKNFFDNSRELQAALGVPNGHMELTISEFSDEQVKAYLAGFGWRAAIPEWLPSRPLLLAYLVHSGLMKDALSEDASVSAAVGWHNLFERICTREAEIEAGIDPPTIRRLIEALASTARSSADGLGPLTPDQIVETFRRVCGGMPDDRSAVLLQRLPGLGGHNSEDGARVFVDQDFAEVARAGGVFEFIEDPFASDLRSEGWQYTLVGLGVEVAAHRCRIAKFSGAKVEAAVGAAIEKDHGATLAVDALLVLRQLGGEHVGPTVYASGVLLPELVWEDGTGGLGRTELQNCIVGVLGLPSEVPDKVVPKFVRCHFGLIEGRTGERDLPVGKFVECTYDEFDASANTTNAILALSLPLGTKVTLTILKKLYLQKGAGRRESALFRGLEPRARNLVPSCLDLLRREGFAVRTKQGDDFVWLPTRVGDSRQRALAMLAAPNASHDALLMASRDIGS